MAEERLFVSGMTLKQAASAGTRILYTAGIDEPITDAHLLLAYVIGGDRMTIVRDPDRILTDVELACYSRVIEKRKQRKPTSRLIGRREFWSLEIKICDEVFDPRPDSETLIAPALALLSNKNRKYMIADLGTGSGCLLFAVLAERPNAWGVGLDFSQAAVDQATENARILGLNDRAQFMVGNWGESLSCVFDLILANPPYISAAENELLAPEVRDFDPRLALDGGEDGLSAYRAVAPQIRRLLKPKGRAIIECGHRQASQVTDILISAGLGRLETYQDLAGIARCVSAAKD